MAFKTNDDPRLVPAYSVAEAAHYLRMHEATLRSWVVGRLYPVGGQTKRSRPLIHLDDPTKAVLILYQSCRGTCAGRNSTPPWREVARRSAKPSTICVASFQLSILSSIRHSRRTVWIFSSNVTGS